MRTWAQGSVCVFPQDQQDPVLVPERLVRKSQVPPNPDNVDATKDARSTSSNGGDDNNGGDGGAALGNSVSFSNTDAGSP